MKNEEIIDVHYGEITLKGKNFKRFENILIKSILTRIKTELGIDLKTQKEMKRLIISNFGEENKNQRIVKGLSKVFGISWIGTGYSCNATIKDVVNLITKHADKKKVYRIEARRIDKTYPKNSSEIGYEISKELIGNGFEPDYKSKEIIYIEWFKNHVNIILKKYAGLGGLPSGASGRVVSLLSGGIDSPVSTWLCMKRGCTPSFLHVFIGDIDDVKKSKIVDIRRKLREYTSKPIDLYLADGSKIYEIKDKIPPRYRTVLFRRFMFLLAQALANDLNAEGIITGDNIAQVASQTLTNLHATTYGMDIPIFRPLLTYDKEEIINLAKKIDTFETSIKKYNDPCMAGAKGMTTTAKQEIVKRIEKEIGLNEIVENVLKGIRRI